eukprot:GFUD01069620.1.p1 GENE.GFUD01069620.1~~GFUD01069620.1.p1  ORF type:complete len:627 (-),score=160.57 GFUD01069620.1:1028-2908(-)
MATEQFCLRWNDFHANITSAFSDIRDDDDFLDVTLVCDGDIVRAHKLVLSACSPLFRVMLKKNSHPQPMIFLRGIRFPDMVAILNFMYHGEVNVNQEDLQMFLAAAEELRIKGLSQASENSKLEKLDNSVPKMKQASGGSNTNSTSSAGQPPAKKPRESSPGISPVSTPVSAKSPAGPDDDEPEPPQLSVKREFAMSQGKSSGDNLAEDDDSQQSNLLDCLVQAQQNFALQQQTAGPGPGPAKTPGFENNINNFSPQHIMQGAGAGQMTSSQGDKDFLVRGSGSPAPNMKFGPSGGLPYEMHRLGGRNEDGLAHVVVMKTFRGWHCPHCSYISPSQKGNLKVHILNRHANPGESFGCMFCGKHLSSRSSLQVHISQVHREQQKAKRMIEERLKITNLEERLKTEMSGGAMGNEIGATAEALRLAMQQEDRIKMEMGNIKNMESMLGSAGMTRMMQMMENDAKNFGGMPNQSGFESGPASSSGSLPQSPKNAGHEQSPGALQSHQSPEVNMNQMTTTNTNNSAPPPQTQQIRRDVELTKVTGNEANLHYQREIGSHHSMAVYRKDDTDDEDDEDDAVAVYPKDMGGDSSMGYRKEMAMETPMGYPQSPMSGTVYPHSHAQSPMTGSE